MPHFISNRMRSTSKLCFSVHGDWIEHIAQVVLSFKGREQPSIVSSTACLWRLSYELSGSNKCSKFRCIEPTNFMALKKGHFALEFEAPWLLIYKLRDWSSRRRSKFNYTRPWGPEGPKKFEWMVHEHLTYHQLDKISWSTYCTKST